MRPHIAALVLSASLALPVYGAPPETPPLPFEDWGACPFECCTYQDWEAITSVSAYGSRSEKSAVVFRVTKGETVRATSGVVVTTSYGKSKVLKNLELPYGKPDQPARLSLQAGDVVYTLHYVGEGVYLFWYKGKTYSDDVVFPDDDDLEIVSRPTSVWWVKIRDGGGKVGWTKHADAFKHVDRCE
jgi:hypothetical protein